MRTVNWHGFWTNHYHWWHWLDSAEHMVPLRHHEAHSLLSYHHTLFHSHSPSLSLPSAGLQGWMGPPIPPGLPRCWAIWCSEKELQGHVMSSPPCQVNERCKNANCKSLARVQVSWDLSVSLLISVHLLIQIFTEEKVICLMQKFSWSGVELSLMRHLRVTWLLSQKVLWSLFVLRSCEL